MDKKLAETEALRKAKEQQYSAGKNTGMSGRDLVRCHFPITIFRITYNMRLQFQFNPEWFEDEEDEDDWDISQYRHTREEAYAELRQPERQLGNLSLDDADGNGSGSER